MDGAHLVSNGLGLLPTLCDYAEVKTPRDILGASVRPLVEGRSPAFWRAVLPVESELGGMIVAGRYKYLLYDEGENREQLIDLEKDPGEMRNAAEDVGYMDVLNRYREIFAAAFGGE